MKFVLITLVAGLLVGCAPTLAPHSPYIPVLRERGEAEVRLGTGIGGSELQLAYQATDNLVLHGGLLHLGRPNSGRVFRSAELGAGYYYLSPNQIWRLGIHGGFAYGSGKSGSSCFDCAAVDRYSKYSVRYTYAYVQPTVIFMEGERHSWSLAMRVGQTYYHQLNEQRYADRMPEPQLYSHAGRSATFVQPMFQTDYRLRRWLRLSSRFGIQGFWGEQSPLNNVEPFVVQGAVHFIVNTRPLPKPQP